MTDVDGHGHRHSDAETAASADEEPVRAVDLFCGAGGLSAALALACERLERPVVLDAVNHWTRAIESHRQNFPWANHHHAKIEELQPRRVVPDGDVHILVAGPECTHYSTARGGKPVDEQKRASPWHVVDWVAKLLPENVLVENVTEFESWGPVIDGEPTRNGTFFEAWVETLRGLGYSVAWRTLNAADYGDATSRKRLFVVARRGLQPEWPEPTHSEDGDEPGTDPWRPAAAVIDWSDVGKSIWTRDRPLVNNTMQRIAEGIRRHGSDLLAPYADAVAALGKEDVERLQERVVPAEYARFVAEAVDEPFLVRAPLVGDHATASLAAAAKIATAVGADDGVDTRTAVGSDRTLAASFLLGQQSNYAPWSVADRPVPTITTTGNISLNVPRPFLLGQQSGSRPRDVFDCPVPTIASRGAISVVDPAAFVLPRNGHYRGLHSNPAYDPTERPLHTVTARNHDGWTVRPYLVPFYNETNQRPRTHAIDAPVPTITATGSDPAVSRPYLVPFYGERSGQAPRTHDVADPLPTVPASKSPAGVTRPFLVKYYGREDAVQGIDRPLGTIRTANTFGVLDPFLVNYHGNSSTWPVSRPLPTLTTTETLALCLPEHYPWGLDVRFRMLQPRELAAAMGFPADYEFAGNKGEVTEQIGNAVPVNLGAALVEQLLAGRDPTLQDFATEPETAGEAAVEADGGTVDGQSGAGEADD